MARTLEAPCVTLGATTVLNFSLITPLFSFKTTYSSVQFSCSDMSDFLWPHGFQHARLPYPSPTPRVCSNSYPLSWWSHPTISSSVVPFSSCLQSFSGSGLFQWVSSLHQVAKGIHVGQNHLPVSLNSIFFILLSHDLKINELMLHTYFYDFLLLPNIAWSFIYIDVRNYVCMCAVISNSLRPRGL